MGIIKILLMLIIFSFSSLMSVAADDFWATACEDPEFKFWFNLLCVNETELLSAIGEKGFYEYTEIDPGLLNSRAERILYFSGNSTGNGLTVWFIDDSAVQLRFDGNGSGSLCGIEIGTAEDELKQRIGLPWIEEGQSLYYNLKWNEAPVRLRFVFGQDPDGDDKNILSEVYLYQVR